MTFLLWLLCTFIAMANLGKMHVLGSDATILIYGVIVFLLGSIRKSGKGKRS